MRAWTCVMWRGGRILVIRLRNNICRGILERKCLILKYALPQTGRLKPAFGAMAKCNVLICKEIYFASAPVNLINRFYLAAVKLKPGYGETGLIVEGNSMYILQKLLVLSNIACPVVAVSVAAAIYILHYSETFTYSIKTVFPL